MYEKIIIGNQVNTLPVQNKEAKITIKSPPGYKIKYRKKAKTAPAQSKNFEMKKSIFQVKKDDSGEKVKIDAAQDQRTIISKEIIPNIIIRLTGKAKIIPDQSSDNHKNREIIQSSATDLAGSKEIISEQGAVNNRREQEVIRNSAIELPAEREVIRDPSVDNHEQQEIIQKIEMTECEEIIQDVDKHVKQKNIQNLLNTIRTGENTMQLCIIKNCKEEAYQDNFCPKHYSEIMKKGSHELTGANLPGKDNNHGKHGNTEYEQEDVMTKVQYFLHSFHARIEKIIETAVQVYNSLFNLEKADKAEICRQLGAKYLRKKNYKKAIPMLKKYVDMNPEDAESQYKLGSAYLSDGLSDEAIICFKKAIMLDPHAMQYHYEIAIAFTQKNLPGEAIASLKKALEINSKNADAYYRLGVLYDNNGEYENAIASYKKAIDLDPKQSNYYHSLGFAYESIKQHEQAVVNFKRAIALEQLAS